MSSSQVWGPSLDDPNSWGLEQSGMASISLRASLQGPAWASSQHGSHRLVQNFPHGSQGLRRQKKVPVSYSALSPDTGSPSLQPYPWVKAVPGDTKAPLSTGVPLKNLWLPLVLHKEQPRKSKPGKTETGL